MRIQTFDTTLRDGTQGEAVSFSVDDKLIVARKLDELGIDYIEGGWPGSNPKDREFFSRARELSLCDTNGGTLTHRLVEIVAEVRKRFDGILGIHTHNDSDVAVANAIAAVEAGCTHVQGCMNGYGERCGNANLCSIIANLELKLGHTTIGQEHLSGLTGVARFIAELANLPLYGDRPFVGHSAFAHNGGVHVSAVLKDSATYEHIAPEAVGNRQRVLVSDLSGRGNVLYKLKQHGLANRLNEDARRELLERIKDMEYQG